MGQNQLFVLHEATVSLYPSDPTGAAIIAEPVWIGACIEQMQIGFDFEEVLMAGTGDEYKTAYHVDERHGIDIARVWVLPLPAMEDYQPRPNQRFVFEIVWNDEQKNRWHKRTYYGVTARNWTLNSNGIMEYGAGQSFRAQYYTQRSGTGIYSPIVAASAEQNVPFFHDGPIALGDYFQGHYLWADEVALESVKVISYAPQTSPCTLTLEVNGVLTSTTIQIPVGTLNQEVSASISPGITIPANSQVRWKCTSAPASITDAAWIASTIMRIRPTGTGVIGALYGDMDADILFTSVGALTTGAFCLGEYNASKSSKIISVVVNCNPPVGGFSVLRPVINGVPDASLDVTIPAGQSRVPLDNLNRSLNVGDQVRWKSVSGPASPLNCPTEVSVNMKVRLA